MIISMYKIRQRVTIVFVVVVTSRVKAALINTINITGGSNEHVSCESGLL